MDALLLAVLALMIVFLVTQNRRRKKEVEAMQSSLEVGSQVVLHAGIMGKVLTVSEEELEIESVKGTKLRVLRGAVGKVIPAEEK
ncbi:MAG: preprotein translocase subunit YajC [Candidatus Aquiluna sp. XM-24bin5]|nr:MAG: preprotein translocase subunit YajC [Candidatus Aquiluna sp. XM-24bin5]